MMKAITKLLGLLIGITILMSSCSEWFAEDDEEYTPPSEVTNLKAELIGKNSVKLTWTNPTEDRFDRISIFIDDPGYYFVSIDDGSEETLLTDLFYNTKYTFFVYSVSKKGYSSDGVDITVTTEDFY